MLLLFIETCVPIIRLRVKAKVAKLLLHLDKHMRALRLFCLPDFFAILINTDCCSELFRTRYSELAMTSGYIRKSFFSNLAADPRLIFLQCYLRKLKDKINFRCGYDVQRQQRPHAKQFRKNPFKKFARIGR